MNSTQRVGGNGGGSTIKERSFETEDITIRSTADGIVVDTVARNYTTIPWSRVAELRNLLSSALNDYRSRNRQQNETIP